ncbi:MAG: hypothetical protein AB8H79_04700 [Myxococcota bacterium]
MSVPTPSSSPRVHREWRNRVIAEYTSAAITARVLHLCIICGLDRGLLDTAARVVTDELDHAQLSDDARVALGDSDEPLGLDVEQLQPAKGLDGPLADLLDHILTSFCLGETFAVPLFAAMREHASHPAIEPMLTRVLKDEAVHRRFGWETLDALLALDPDGVRARAARILPGAIRSYRLAYHDVQEGEPLTDHERAAGLLPIAEYRRIFQQTLAQTITPRLRSRGILIDTVADAPA